MAASSLLGFFRPDMPHHYLSGVQTNLPLSILLNFGMNYLVRPGMQCMGEERETNPKP